MRLPNSERSQGRTIKERGEAEAEEEADADADADAIVGQEANTGNSSATRTTDAAFAFYKALKVYPTPRDLISIYDKTVDKVWTRPPFRLVPTNLANTDSLSLLSSVCSMSSRR